MFFVSFTIYKTYWNYIEIFIPGVSNWRPAGQIRPALLSFVAHVFQFFAILGL